MPRRAALQLAAHGLLSMMLEMLYLPLLSPDEARALIEKARAIITAEG